MIHEMNTSNVAVPAPPSVDCALRATNLGISFGHVEVLRSVSLEIRRGEVVALIGDNGAGKSTLTKCLCGVYQPDSGTIELDGVVTRFESIRDSEAAGIGVVHQDLALAPDLSVLENIFLGHEVLMQGWRQWLGVLNRKGMAVSANSALSRLAAKVPSVAIPTRVLSGGQRQAVAIARAVMWSKSVIILDEPTAALGARQSAVVGGLIREIARSGLGVMVISHDLPKMLEVADRVVVLWKGTVAIDLPAKDLTVPDMVAAMVGHAEDVR